MRPRIPVIASSVGLPVIAAIATGVGHATSPGGPPMYPVEPPDGVRACATRTEGPRVVRFDKDRDLRIGRVVFMRLGQAQRAISEPSTGRDFSVKVVIAVRAGAPVVLRVPPGERESLALNYATNNNGHSPQVRQVDDGQHHVLVKPCAPNTRRFSDGRRIARWTLFSGGFVFRELDCYTIEVSGFGKQYLRRRIALGRRCGSGYAEGGPR